MKIELDLPEIEGYEYRANRFPTDHAPIYKALKEIAG